MQNVVVEKPYRFVPPHRGWFWPTLVQFWLPRILDRSHGITRVECRGIEHLKRSLDAGHGILLAPNHCRPCDPLVLGMLGRELNQPFFTMASAHLFLNGGLLAWLLPRVGAFSVYREGMDREALKTAIDILKEAKRPLVIFPEGVISRTNDRLNNLQDGVAFIARSAAKQRLAANPPGNVVVHPVAIRYLFKGELDKTLALVLDDIERRLSWQPQRGVPVIERIYKLGFALLCLKEMEYLGAPQTDEVADRLSRLIDQILSPLEKEWLGGHREPTVVLRVKKLRAAILPDLVGGEVSEDERARRWRQLGDIYLAQSLSNYPPDYIRSNPTPERLLETVERFEEDLTDETHVHRPVHAIVDVGEAIEVSPARDRSVVSDPLMERIKEQLTAMLARLTKESSNGHKR